VYNDYEMKITRKEKRISGLKVRGQIMLEREGGSGKRQGQRSRGRMHMGSGKDSAAVLALTIPQRAE